MLTAIRFIFMLELRTLWRRSQEWWYPALFFIIVMSLFPLALTPDPVFLQKYSPGGLWIAALLASLLSVETIFDAEMEDGHLEQWVLTPVPLSLIVLSKLAAHWLVTLLPLMLLTPIFGVIFHLPVAVIMALLFSLLAGTPVLLLLGSLGVALTLGLRQQGVLLSLLVLPLSLPVLILAVSLTQQAQSGAAYNGTLSFLASLAVLSITLLPSAIAAILRISLDD